MAKKKEIVVKKFNFSYGELKQMGDAYVDLLDRDIAEFTDKGYTPAKRATLVEAIETFAGYKTDEQMEGMQMTATAAKDTARAVVEKQVRSFQQAAKTVFGNTARCRAFGNNDLSRQSEEQLLRTAKLVGRMAAKYLTELEPEGITAAKIATLSAARTLLDDAIDGQIDSVNNRDIATEMRTALANDLYALISKYSETGKDIWIEVSEAKYNDYVIYDVAGSQKATVTEHLQ